MGKKIILLLLSVIFVFAGCGVKEKNTDIYQTIIKRDKLIVGVQYDAKPFGYIDTDGKLKGVDVDIAKEIGKRLLGDTDKVEFKEVTPATRIQSVTAGDVDIVVATMSITPQRKMIVDFSSPYYIAGQAIVVPEKSDINSFYELNKKNVIVVLGTTGERNLRLVAPSAIVQGYRNYTEAFKAFKKGNSDALTTDDALLIGFVMDNKDYKILPKRLTQEPYGVAFKNSEEAAKLKGHINRILSDMREDGFMNKLKKKWNI